MGRSPHPPPHHHTHKHTQSLFPFPAALGWGWGGGGGKLATGSEEKSKEVCEGVKRKKKAGDGVSPPEPGSPQPGSGSEKTGGGEKEVVRWREDSERAQEE